MFGRCSCPPPEEGAGHIPFVLSQPRADFAVFSPRVAEKGNSNILAHFSFQVFTGGGQATVDHWVPNCVRGPSEKPYSSTVGGQAIIGYLAVCVVRHNKKAGGQALSLDSQLCAWSAIIIEPLHT